ncbi:hypothetical protein P0M11_02240 [Kaistella sp. PBT33-4]|uniref:hypothetical protein n=1 Tax=Kaistella sp. PBT33-4 TaxID=3032000 RepID=UPI0023D85FAB|nr:hypothetical protein [Kaistella sp. PBT33-4]MDF0718810.1 hypothetical protein [Kaistella sp. PBT33-4]
MNLKTATHNYLFLISAQMFALLLNIVISLIFPKVMSMEDFGFWQLFLFFCSFAGFFHLGLNDGVYLRYGGKKYKIINKEILKGQFVMLLGLQLLFFIVLNLYLFFFEADSAKYHFVVLFSLVYMFVSNLASYSTSLLQSTNRLREFSYTTMLASVLLVAFFTVLLVLGCRSFGTFILFYIITYSLVLIPSFYLIREVLSVRIHFKNKVVYFKEFRKNISAGSKLMISSVAGMLIVGCGRFIIERKWGIVEFGKVSLAITVTTLFIFFIRQVGIVIFPLLKNGKYDMQKFFYIGSLRFLNVTLYGFLLFYPAVFWLVHLWLPAYASNLLYFVALLPVCVYEGKMQILLSTYMKVLRKERLLMKVNIACMLLSLILCLVGAALDSVLFIMISMTFGIALRGYLMERALEKAFLIKVFWSGAWDFILSVTFLCAFIHLLPAYAFILYLSVYIAFLFVNWKNLSDFYMTLKRFKTAAI